MQFRGLNVAATLGIDANPSGQLRSLAANPLDFVEAAANTLSREVVINTADLFFTGRDDATWNAEGISNPLRFRFAVPGLLLLLLVGILSGRPDSVPRALAVGALGFLLMTTTLFVVHVGFSPVGGKTVAWLQGRYLILPVFLMSWPVVELGRRVLDLWHWYDRPAAAGVSSVTWFAYAAFAATSLIVMLNLHAIA